MAQAETVWVLESAYELAKTETVRVLEHILANQEYVLQEAAAFRDSLENYRTGSADFADYLILAAAQAAKTELVTSDRVSASFVSADLRERESDVIWRVRSAGGWLCLTWLRRVLLPGRFPGLEFPEGLRLAEDEALLAERVKEWTQVWREEGVEQGLEKGREEGLEQGRAAERRMLLRQVERRFGATTAEAAAPLLARFDRPEPFERVGEWVIDCEQGEDLLARLRTLVP